jgi:hypothetical protein
MLQVWHKRNYISDSNKSDESIEYNIWLWVTVSWSHAKMKADNIMNTHGIKLQVHSLTENLQRVTRHLSRFIHMKLEIKISKSGCKSTQFSIKYSSLNCKAWKEAGWQD